MKIGFVGLGKMGGNMVLRLVVGTPDGAVRGGHQVVGYARDRNPDLEGVAGVEVVNELKELVKRLEAPRVVWVMVPAGQATESVISELRELLSKDDIIIDGGNSYYKDSTRRAEALAQSGFGFVDCGTSGGIWGRAEGYCMMIGGDKVHVDRCAPLFDTLAPEKGWAHVGSSGSGHFVKMAHNGAEYGIMESYGEVFEIMRKSQFDLDLHQVAAVWNRGSVIRSWLLELAEQMLKQDPTLRSIQPYVEDSGEGRWTVQAAIEESVAAPVIAASLFARFESRDTEENYSARFAAALRKQFGGHDVHTKDVTTKTTPDQRQVQPEPPATPK